MSDRSKLLMNKIWESRNNGSDTEEKLISSVINHVAEMTKYYHAQNDLVVLDKEDLLNLAKELLDDTI